MVRFESISLAKRTRSPMSTDVCSTSDRVEDEDSNSNIDRSVSSPNAIDVSSPTADRSRRTARWSRRSSTDRSSADWEDWRSTAKVETNTSRECDEESRGRMIVGVEIELDDDDDDAEKETSDEHEQCPIDVMVLTSVKRRGMRDDDECVCRSECSCRASASSRSFES